MMEKPSFQLVNGDSPLSLTHKFILPESQRPLLSDVSPLASVPVIDMMNEVDADDDHQYPSSSLVKKISQACEDYGFFQIVNHGVPSELYQNMMDLVTQFFHLSLEERAPLYMEDKAKPSGGICHSYFNVEGQERVTLWSETFAHPLYPSDDFDHHLPENPPQYRELAAEYHKRISGLVFRLLGLISHGLGLEQDFLQKRIGYESKLRLHAHYYPPCPDPKLTLGLLSHTDLNLLTVLQQSQGVTGLQVIKDGKWLSVDPAPNSFIVNVGDQLQVLSNGRYKSVKHRAVTNKDLDRVSLAMFCSPSRDAEIGPIEDLIDEEHPPRYRKFFFWEFLQEFSRQDGTEYTVKEAFEI